jgi:hypothetical protein
VGDRNNNRVQIFDQDFKLLDSWAQFSRPSGVFIDANDVIYVADSESESVSRGGSSACTATRGWKRGIRIGSAKDRQRSTCIIPEVGRDDKGTTTLGRGHHRRRPGSHLRCGSRAERTSSVVRQETVSIDNEAIGDRAIEGQRFNCCRHRGSIHGGMRVEIARIPPLPIALVICLIASFPPELVLLQYWPGA